MNNRLMISVATAALIAGTGLANAQGMGGGREGGASGGAERAAERAVVTVGGATSHEGRVGRHEVQPVRTEGRRGDP